MSTEMKTPVRIGIAGLGRSGWDIHVQGLRLVPELYKIIAVTDPNPARRQEAQNEFKCRAYENFEGLLKDNEIELIVVATPSRLHPQNAIDALQAGKHAVCEKPLAGNAAEADEMIRTAQKTSKVLAPFQNRRYAGDFLKVREVINSGKLGRIVMIRIANHGFARRWDWQTLKEFGGGSLNNTGPHLIDMALQLFGPAEPEVFCHLERALTSGDAEDHCKVLLRAKGAPMIDIEVTSACAYPQEPWLVMGTHGGMKSAGSKIEWKYVDFSQLPPRPVDRNPTPDRSYNSETLSWLTEECDCTTDFHVMTANFYRDVYKTLREGSPLVITPESVRRQIALLEKCHTLCPV
jgi:scyllo-inositol 2-dehydrogenase (NADP+)